MSVSRFQRLFGLPNYYISEQVHDPAHPDTLLLVMDYLNFTMPNGPCDVCKESGTFVGHGRQERRCRDVMREGKHVELLIRIPRYRCNQCSALYRADDEVKSFIDNRRGFSKRLVAEIQRKCLTLSYADVEREYQIPSQSIKNMFMDCVATYDSRFPPYSPRVLGMDEAHIGESRGKKRIIGTFLDIENKLLMDITPNRYKATLEKFLDNLPDNHKIEVVVIDMTAYYRDIIRLCLPGAKIVVDRFHVVSLANIAMDEVRKHLQRKFSRQLSDLDEQITEAQRLRNTTLYTTLESQRREAQRKYDLLKDSQTRRTMGFGRDKLRTGGMTLLARVFAEFPDLQTAYELKEGIRSVYTQASKADAEALYSAWVGTVPSGSAFKLFRTDVQRAFRNWSEEIFNYYDHPYTNGPTESRNNLIKILNRTGRGHSFEVLRFKLRHGQSGRLVLPVFTKLNKDGSVMIITDGFESIDLSYRELLKSYLAGNPLPEGIDLKHGMGIDDSSVSENESFQIPESMYAW